MRYLVGGDIVYMYMIHVHEAADLRTSHSLGSNLWPDDKATVELYYYPISQVEVL